MENALLDPKQEINYSTSKFYDMTRVNEIRMVKGFFWERLELENFPLDTQELSVVVTSKFTNKEIDLITDPEHSSSMTLKLQGYLSISKSGICLNLLILATWLVMICLIHETQSLIKIMLFIKIK